MTAADVLQILVYLVLLAGAASLLGGYLARVLAGERVLPDRLLGPVERLIYRACGIDAAHEQHWLAYAASLLAFNLVSVLALYALLRPQHLLPLNPQMLGPVAPDLAFNTAVSFVTNTNWQAWDSTWPAGDRGPPVGAGTRSPPSDRPPGPSFFRTRP